MDEATLKKLHYNFCNCKCEHRYGFASGYVYETICFDAKFLSKKKAQRFLYSKHFSSTCTVLSNQVAVNSTSYAIIGMVFWYIIFCYIKLHLCSSLDVCQIPACFYVKATAVKALFCDEVKN